MITWPSGAKVTISLAKCGAIETIRRVNPCLSCRGGFHKATHGTDIEEGCTCCNATGKHKGVAEWEAQFITANDPDSFMQLCPSGHPYNEDNTYWTPGGKRKCRECKREKAREIYARAA